MWKGVSICLILAIGNANCGRIVVLKKNKDRLSNDAQWCEHWDGYTFVQSNDLLTDNQTE
jgi:hypothetical protein